MNAWELYKKKREKEKQEEAEKFNGREAWNAYMANRQAETIPPAAPPKSSKPLLPKGSEIKDNKPVEFDDPYETPFSPVNKGRESNLATDLLTGKVGYDPASLLKGELGIPFPEKETGADRGNILRDQLNDAFWAKNAAFFTGKDYAGKKEVYEDLKAQVAAIEQQEPEQEKPDGFMAEYFQGIKVLPDSWEGLGRGLAYNAERAAAGALGFGEGITDFLGTAFYKGVEGLTSGFGLAPNKVSEWAGNAAQGFLDNSVTDDYLESIRLRYNPTVGEEAWGGLTQGTADVLASLASGKAIGNLIGKGAGIIDDAAQAVRDSNITKAVFGTSAAGRGAKEAYDEGATTGQALTYGAASGLTEVLVESLAGGIPGMGEGAIGKVVKKIVDSPAVSAVLDVLGEGGEEAISAVVTPLIKRAVYDPDANFATWEEVGESAVLGILTSLGLQGMSAPAAIGNVVNNAQYNSYVKQADQAERAQLLQNALNIKENGIPQNTDVADTAAQETVNQPYEISNSQVERMIRDQATMQEMGIDVNGKTMSQLRNEVRAVLAAQEQGAQERSVETGMQTPTQETVPTVNPVASQEESRRRMGAGEVATAILGENGAKAFRTAYNQDVASRVDEQTAVTGFNTVYKATLDGRTLTAEEKAQTASLPESLKLAAGSSAILDRQRASQAKYFGENAGLVKDANFKKMHLSYRTESVLDAVAKITGTRIQFVSETVDDADGTYKDGVIQIKMGTKDPVMTVLTHEVVHRIRETSPEVYTAMAEFVRKNLSSVSSVKLSTYYSQRYSTTDVSYFTEEMIADSFGTILRDSKAMEQFAKDDRNAFEKFLGAIRDLINAVRRALSGKVELDAGQIRYFRELESQLVGMERAMTDALKSLPVVEKENATPEGSEMKFSTKNDVLALDNVDWMGNFTSIKDQLAKHAKEINSMEPVAEVEYTPKSGKNLGNLIADAITQIGGKNMKNSGLDFAFDKEGINSILVHAKSAELQAAALASPYVAKYGKIIAGQKNHEIKGLTTLTFAAPVVINGDTVNVGVAIQFQANGRPRAVNVGLQNGGVFNLDMTKAPKGLDSRVNRYGQGTSLPTEGAFKKKVSQPFGVVNPEVETAVEKGEPISALDGVKRSLKWDSKFMDAADRANNGRVSTEVMKAAREARQAVADIFNDPELADSLGLPQDIIGNTYIPNGSYSGTEENTTVCIRSIAADDLMDAIAEHLGRPLTVEDTIAISQEYWKYTDKPECLYCYVAMDRKAHREFLGSYLQQRDDVLKNIHSGMNKEDAYQKFLDGRKDTKPMRDRFEMWLRNDGKDVIGPADLASYRTMEKAIERNGALKAQINDALKYAQSASWAKKRLGYTAYNNHILKWKQTRINNLNSNYGLRLYSFSDFSPAFILENMQMITDAAVRGLKVLAYTKELDFVRIFAKSGMNINISVFGYSDGNGGVAMDAMQGADWAEVQAMREKYPNVGCTFVATNDEQVDWALEQEWIDVIIPFHMVRTGTKVASHFGWKNYTAMSADTKAEGWTSADAKHILPPMHQNNKAMYLEACEANHLTPRFNDWVDHPNYMKLVNETRMSEGDSKPVQPIFDVDAANDSIEVMRKQGGYYTPIGGSYENMYDIAEEIAKKIAGKQSKRFDTVLASAIDDAVAKYVGENKADIDIDVEGLRRAAQQAVKDAQLAGMMNQGRKDAEKIRKAKETTAEVRRKRDEKIQKMKDHQREMREKNSESRHAADYRNRIERHVKELSRTLRNPTDKKHVPEVLRKPVAKLLESINLESKGGEPTKRTQAFNELKKVYTEIAGDVVIDPDLLGGDGATGLLDDVIAMVDKRIAEMNTAELEVVWKALRAVEASVRSFNKMFSAARFKTVSEAAEGLRSDNLFKRSKTEWNYIDKLQKLTSIDMLTPEAFFHRMGKSGDAIFRMLRNAQDKHIRLMAQVADFTQENLSDVDVRTLEKEMHTVKLGGQDVELSTAQIMELYALMRRPQAMEHLVEGGILPDTVSKKGLKKAARAEPVYGVSAEDLMEAISLLSDEQIQVAELLQGYASTTLSDWGNEASMEVYGYRKFNEEYYWPIRSNRQEVKGDIQKETQVTTVANRGFTKNVTPHANNSVMVGSIFDTFASHSSDMATYAAWLGTSEDVNRIRNFVFRVVDEDSGKARTIGTVKGIFDRVYGAGKGQQYLQKLLADIANGVKGVDVSASLTDGLVSNTKAASVGANLRVIIQQPTAIFRAFDMVDPKYFVSGANPVKGFEKAKQYAPIAVWKDWGYFDIHTGKQMKDVLFDSAGTLNRIKEAAMWGAGKMDSLSWGVLWNAIENETKAKNDMAPGTEKFYQKVAERFNEVIDRTQVVDGILQRSQIMRDPGDLKKMATSFMGEPTKQYNMLLSAWYDTKMGKVGGKRALIRTGMSLVAAGILNSAMQSLMDALRDDDREQDYWEKWLEAFVGIGADDNTALMRFLNSNVGSAVNPLTYIPYLKDFWSLIQGYDVSRMDMDSADRTLSAASNLVKAIRGEGKQTLLNASVTMLAEFSRVLGLPVANLKRDITAFALTAISETDNFLMEYRAKKTMYKVSENPAMFYDVLFSAYQSDREAYEFIYADMVKSGLSDEKIKTGMETRMKKAQGVKEVDDLDRRYLSPEQENAYNRYHKELESSKLWRRATEQQKDSVEDDLYNMLSSTAAGLKVQDKLEDGARYGVSETEYLLYQLALSMADKPTESGNYGSYTNAEVKSAIDMLGLSRRESAWLWEAQGKSEKSNPYK